MNVVWIALAMAALGLACWRLVSLSEEGGAVSRNVRYDLMAVVAFSLMLLSPLLLRDLVGRGLANWIRVLFAGIGLVLLLLAERIRRRSEQRHSTE
jgi:hypothetical protein